MKALVFVLMGVGFAAILIAAFWVRSRTPVAQAGAPRSASTQNVRQQVKGPEVEGRIETPVYEEPPQPAGPSEAAVALREASVRSTLAQFRVAEVSGTTLIKKKLLETLRRDEDLAVRLAEQQLAGAKSPTEAASIRKVIQAIRR